MKKYLFAITAALLSLAACNKEIVVDEPVNNNETTVLTFTSARPQFDADTRTSWNGSAIEWTANVDKIKVGFTFDGDWWGQTEAYGAESESPNDHIKFYQSDAVTIDDTDACLGTFKVSKTFTGPTEEGDFVFYAVFPDKAIDNNNQDAAPVVNINLKSEQIPAANSFDGTADLMVGKSATITSTGLPSAAIDLDWTRIVAHGLFTLKDFQGVEAGETITNVVFTAQEGANLTGEQTVSIADGTVTATSKSSNSITLEGTNLAFVTEDGKTNLKVWLSVIPARLTSLNVLVTTSKATYAREIPGIDKTLMGNACNKLGINMSTATRTAQAEYDWVKKDLSAITADDVFVIVGNNGNNYAMTNDNGTGSAPVAYEVMVSGNKLASNPAEKIQWTLTKDGSDYTFYPNGTTATWLYCTSGTGNKVRVGTNTDGKLFTLDDSGYLKNAYSNYLGVYNSQDWRCYSSTTTGNIAGQTFAFYVRTAATPSKPVPTISFDDPTTEVNVGASVENPATIDPSTLTITYSSSDENIASVDENGKVTGEGAGTATITASFAGDNTYDEASASYEITVIDPNANDGSEAKPYTASEAIAVAEHLGTETKDVYVKGIVCTTGSVNTTYNSVTYYISDDGTTTSRLQIYSGKYIDGANFTEENNLKLGDYVVVYGTLKLFNNSTPEIDKNSEIQSVFRAPTFSPDGGSFNTASTTVEISAESGATIRYTIDGTDPTSTSGSVYSGTITITETTTVKAIAIKDNIATGVSSATFTKTTSSDVLYSLYSGALTEGDYVIVYNGKAMKNTVSNNRLGYAEVTVSGNDIANPDASIVWHIASSGDYWTIYNAAVLKYAAGNGTKNQGALEDTVNDKSLWTASGSSTYNFVNKNNAASSVNAYLRNNGTYGFACYGTGTGGALSLYKKN